MKNIILYTTFLSILLLSACTSANNKIENPNTDGSILPEETTSQHSPFIQNNE